MPRQPIFMAPWDSAAFPIEITTKNQQKSINRYPDKNQDR